MNGTIVIFKNRRKKTKQNQFVSLGVDSAAHIGLCMGNTERNIFVSDHQLAVEPVAIETNGWIKIK